MRAVPFIFDSLDSTIVMVHSDCTGALKNSPQSIGKSRGGCTTKIHMVATDARTAVTFSLSPGQAHDAPAGRELLSELGAPVRPVHLLMDRAYEEMKHDSWRSIWASSRSCRR